MRRIFFVAVALIWIRAPQALAQGDACDPASKKCEFTFGELADGKITADNLKIPMNSPTTPAGAIIGDDELALTTLRTASDLTPQLLAAFDDNFELQPGLAIGGAPYWWFEPRETIVAYQNSSPFERILKRTQFGLATKMAPADDGATSNRALLGVSLGWQLLDSQDVRSKHFEPSAKCLADTIQIALPAVIDEQRAYYGFAAYTLHSATPGAIQMAVAALRIPVTPDTYSRSWFVSDVGRAATAWAEGSEGGIERVPGYAGRLDAAVDALTPEQETDAKKLVAGQFDKPAFNKAVKACQGTYAQILTESPSLSLNVAAGFASDTGKYDNLSPERTALWLTYNSGTPATDAARRSSPDYKEPFNIFGAPFIGFLSYSLNEKVKLPNDSKVEADRLTFGVGTSFKRGEDEAFDFQASFIKTDFDADLQRSSDYRVSISYSKKLQDYVWLELKAGTTNSDELDDATFAGVSLKVDWAAMLGLQE